MSSHIINRIISNTEIAPWFLDMRLEFLGDMAAFRPGKIAHVYLPDETRLLPRPISLCDFSRGEKWIRLVYQVVGGGTDLLSRMKAGDSLRMLAPSGNGYELPDGGDVVLVGGGIGVPPMLGLARELCRTRKVTAVLGFRNKDSVILADDFRALGIEPVICTDDGSLGYKGNTVAYLREANQPLSVVCACGPKIMLKYLAELCAKKNAECFVSMEERMACGVGVCLGCAIKVHGESGFVYKKVCKDGPVFNAKEVVWE